MTTTKRAKYEERLDRLERLVEASERSTEAFKRPTKAFRQSTEAFIADTRRQMADLGKLLGKVGNTLGLTIEDRGQELVGRFFKESEEVSVRLITASSSESTVRFGKLI